jgi:hypothetical protein
MGEHINLEKFGINFIKLQLPNQKQNKLQGLSSKSTGLRLFSEIMNYFSIENHVNRVYGTVD